MPLASRLRAPVTTPQLAAMRGFIATELVDTCTIQRNTATTDDMGGYEPDWDALASDVPCRVVDASGLTPQERLAAERVTSDQPWLIYLPNGQDVTARDRIVVAARTFEVLAVNTGQTQAVVRRCICRVDE